MPAKKPTSRTLQILGAIMAVGLLVRVVWVCSVNTQPVTDFNWYFQKAAQISLGQGYHDQGIPTAYWPVGWPAALGICFSIAGPSLAAAKAFTTILTWAAIPLTFLLGKKLFHRDASALVGAGIIAIHPHFIAYSSILASEPLFTCLTLAFFIFQADAVKKPFFSGLSGFFLGLSCFVRPQAILLPLLHRAFCWRTDASDRRGSLTALAICLLICLGVLAPWLSHTKAVFGRFVFVSTNGGDNLLIGHHPGATGRYANPDKCGLDRPETMSEGERDQAALKQGLANIKADPITSLKLIPAKLAETLWTTTDAAYWAFQTSTNGLTSPGSGSDRQFYKWFKATSQWSQWLLLAMATLGLARLALSSSRSSLPALLSGIVLPLILSAVFFGNPRFFFAAIPLCSLLTGALAFPPGGASKEPPREGDSQAV